MKEAVLYKKLANGKVQCTACNHYCVIPEGKTGICGVRKNIDGKLYLLVYGVVVAQNVNPIEKKPLYHFLPGTKVYSIGTVGCNFRCAFCQNWDISQTRVPVGEKMTPEEIVSSAVKNGCKSIAYTYNEPTIFAEYISDTAKLAKKKHLKNILVTNGYMSKECLDYLAPNIDAANVDLKAFSDNFYKKHTAARLKPVLDTIKRMHKRGIWLEITTLIIPGENDSSEELEKIAKFISKIDKNIPWHISRFYPQYKMLDKNPTSLKSLRTAKKIGEKYLKYVYVGNVYEDSHTFCKTCNNPIIERRGYYIENKMKRNKCPFCGNDVEGVFE